MNKRSSQINSLLDETAKTPTSLFPKNEGQPLKNENLRVAIRVRPPMEREIKDGKFISTV